MTEAEMRAAVLQYLRSTGWLADLPRSGKRRTQAIKDVKDHFEGMVDAAVAQLGEGPTP